MPKSDAINKTAGKILTALAVFFPVSEVIKQIMLTVRYGCYDWWYFPFQLCSLPIYLLPIYVVLKRGKMTCAAAGDRSTCVRRRSCGRRRTDRVLGTFLVDFGLLGGIFAFADRSGMHYDLPVLTCHSYLWHAAMIVMGIALIVLNRGVFFWRDFLLSVGLYGLCCLLATCFNVSFHRLGSINMFYISPFYRMTQVVFIHIAETYGDTVGRLCYIGCNVLGAFLIHLIIFVLFRNPFIRRRSA